MGGVHATAAANLGDFVVGVVDPDPSRRIAFVQAHGGSGYSGLDEAFSEADFDVAVVTTPSHDHLTTTTRIVEQGRHVLVEKPHRLPNQDPSGLLAALNARPEVCCQVGMSLRFAAGAREVRDAVVARELGEILTYQDRTMYQLTAEGLAPWYFDHSVSGGGVSLTNGVHAVDRVRWILGEVDDWSMRSEKVFEDHDDEDLAVITARRVSDAAQVAILLAWGDWQVSPSELLIVGTRGQALIHERDGWSVNTPSGSRGGPNDPLAERFSHQWASFREAVAGGEAGPQLDELEPVLEILRRITPSRPTLRPDMPVSST